MRCLISNLDMHQNFYLSLYKIKFDEIFEIGIINFLTEINIIYIKIYF